MHNENTVISVYKIQNSVNGLQLFAKCQPAVVPACMPAVPLEIAGAVPVAYACICICICVCMRPAFAGMLQIRY